MAEEVEAQSGEENRLKAESLATRIDLGSFGICLYKVDTVTEQAFFSPSCASFLRLLGYPLERFLDARFWLTIIHPEDRAIWEEAHEKLSTGKRSYCQYRILNSKGDVRWLSDKAEAVINGGQITHFEGVLVDLTAEIETKQRLARKNQELSALYSIAQTSSQTLNQERLLVLSLEKTLLALGAEAGAIFLFEKDGETLRLHAQQGWSPEMARVLSMIRWDDSAAKQVVPGQDLTWMQPDSLPGGIVAMSPRDQLQPSISVPLLSHGTCHGILFLHFRPSWKPQSQDLSLFQTVGLLLGQALRNSQLHQQVERELAKREAFSRMLRLAEIAPDAAKERTEQMGSDPKPSAVSSGAQEMILSMLDASSNPAYLLTQEGTLLASNQSGADQLGLSASDLMGRSLWDFLSADAAAHQQRMLEEASASHQPIRFEETRDAKTFTDTLFPLPRSSGVDGFVLYQEDISEELWLVQQLQQSRADLRAILDASPDIIALIDRDGAILEANREAYHFLGKKPELIGERKIQDLFSSLVPKSRRKMAEIAASHGHEVAFEERIDDHDIEFRIFPILDPREQVSRLAVFARDISTRRWLEHSLAQSETRLHQVLENMSDLVTEIDGEGRLIYVSPGFPRTLGYPPAGLEGTYWLDLLHEEDRAYALVAFLPIGNGEKVIHLESRVLHADGHPVWMEMVARALPKEGQESIGVILNMRDISERKRIEQENEQLKEEGFFFLLRESSEDIGLIQDGKLVYANPSLARLLGEVSPGSVLGRDLVDYVVEADKKKVTSALQRYQNHSQKTGEPLELILRRADGGEVPIEGTLQGVDFRGARGALFRGLDISARRRAEQALRRETAKKITGELTAGIAHQIRNPLFVISLSVQSIEKKLPAKDPQRRLTQAILDKVHKLDEVTADLVHLGKYHELHFTHASLRRRLELALILVRAPAIAQRVKVVRRYGLNLPRAWMDEAAMDEVFANLLTNALEAMPEGGLLTVETSLDEERKELLVRIQDSGCGIPKAVAERIFIPFSTTKESGSGLGLVFCQRIVEEHGGRLTFQSETDGEGHGTIFQIAMPISRSALGRRSGD
ncbi:MAG: PAS domain S-box protein [bacterium]